MQPATKRRFIATKLRNCLWFLEFVIRANTWLNKDAKSKVEPHFANG